MRALSILLPSLLLGGCAVMEETMNQIGAGDLYRQAAGTAREAKTALLGPDEEEERLIGEQAAATLLGAAPLLADRDAQRYVNLVGRWIASHGSRPELDWRFGILDTPHVGAFAAPGGYVFVTRGLLLELRNESELAGVLAHEITHVEERHHLQGLRRQAGFALAERLQPDLTTMSRIADGARELYSRGLDRGDEYAADRAGARLARRAGYDPYGLLAALQTLDSLNPDDSRLALMFDTHPRTADRVQRLDQDLLQQGDSRTRYDAGAARYAAHLARLAR